MGALLAASVAPAGGEGTEDAILRPIPSSGERLPVIGLGTWQTFDVGDAETAPLEAVLRAFIELGGKVIDSSPMYGRSEQVVGKLAEKIEARGKLFIATKVWTRGREQGIAQMKDSMAHLRSDPIDLLQVHNLVDVNEHLATLREWKKEGRVRYIGVTHYRADGHDDVARWVEKGGLDFIQINYSVAEREAEKRLLLLAADHGVAVIVNRPFAGGDALRRLLAKPLPDWAGDAGCSSWAQLLLKFVISHPAVTCAIPATSKEGHLRDNMAAGRGLLPDGPMRKRIAALL